MKIRILTSKDVTLALPMAEAIEVVKNAFGQFSAGKATMPLRSRLQTEMGITLLMPAYLRESKSLAIKIVSVYEENTKSGLPTVSAIVIVHDPLTGMPLAIMDGTSLTAIRTGAAGGLAADLLSRKDAKKVTLFGAGVQGRSQLLGVMAVRKIDEVFIIDSIEEASHKLSKEILSWPNHPTIRIQPPLKDAIQGADIIITATTSTNPLFDGNDLKPGTHITAIGAFTPDMQEIDKNTAERARIIVDSREACLAEAGDIIKTKAHIDAELGDIINGQSPERQNQKEITLFKTVGLAVQDAAAAAAVLKRAEELDLGTTIEMS